MSNLPTRVSEYDAIAKTVQHYVNGAKSGRGTDMKPAFHKDATIFGYFDGALFAGPIQGLFDFVDQDGPATGDPSPDCQHRHHRHDRHGAVGNRQLDWPPVHRFVHVA